MEQIKINHAAVWVSVILLFALGFLWYGPLFGEPWMEMVGLDMATVEANPPGAAIWLSNAFATVLPLYILAWLYTKIGVNSLTQGAMIGFLIGFAFVFLSKMVGGFFAQDPYGLAWITGGYDVVSLTLAGAILGVWTKRA